MLVTDKELKSIVSDTRNLNIGRNYWQSGYVKKIKITADRNNHYLIKGVVDNDSYQNDCQITVDENNKIIDYQCDCFWCDDISACGHIAAVLFKVQELSPDYFPFIFEEKTNDENAFLQQLMLFQEKQKQARINSELSLTRNLINNYKEDKINQFSLISQSKKDIEVQIITSDYYALKFRVGNEKKYAIKNITKFIEAIEDNKLVKYGKQLEFVHTLNAFSEDALKIIELMKYCLNNQKYYEFYPYFGGFKNEIEIDSTNIDYIYETLSQLKNTNKQLDLYEIDRLIALNIIEQDDYYQIELEDFNGICGKKDIYLIEDNTIELIKLDNDGKALQFIKNCLNKDELLLSKKDLNDFNKYLFNDIKKYFDINGVNFSDSKTEAEAEVLTLYGDIDEYEQVKLYLECKQNNQIFYSFDHDGFNTSMDFDLIENYLKEISDVIDYNEHCVYLNLDNEKTYQFLNQGLPFLANYCEIMVSDALRKIGQKSQFSITVGVSIENDLLAIDIDSIDIPSQELTDVLNAYRRKKKFHRLKSGKLLYLESDELEELDNLMNDYHLSANMIEDGHLDMNVYRAFSIDNKADNSNHLVFNRSDVFKNVIDNFKNTKKQTFALSNHYQKILRDYQKFGYQWLRLITSYGFGGVLADDMGLGKTLQIIALLDECRDVNKTSLVVCPSSLLLNWHDEICRFSPNLKCKCVHGNLTKRKKAISAFDEADVLITTYDYMRRDYKLYEDYEFEFVILDEAQYIKNPKTKNASAVKSLNSKHRFALTGTPIENSLAELWSIFDFLMPDYLFNYHYFQGTYETPIVKNQDEDKQLELKKLISPFILRRNKRDVLKELPDKIEKTMLLEFSEEESKLYLANLMQVNKELQEKMHYEKVDRIVVLAMLTRLRQICCEPRLLYDNILHISSKLEGCLELIRNFQGNNQKVLLFSSFTSMLDLISDELEKQQISYYKLTGATSKEKRHQLVEQFQNDNTTVFLISLKAGGTGLNLTAAEAVIHFDPWWNMSAQNQATDRAYRIGQKNVVTVYKLVMKNSVEEKILELQNKKKNLADTFVENNEGNITSMSTEEIINLFSI